MISMWTAGTLYIRVLKGNRGSGGQREEAGRRKHNLGKPRAKVGALAPCTWRAGRPRPALLDNKDERGQPRPMGRRSGPLRGQNYSTDPFSLARPSEMTQKLNFENRKQMPYIQDKGAKSAGIFFPGYLGPLRQSGQS